MPLTRVELCTDGLDPASREALLEAVWAELRISPGMVSADGNVELALVQCGAAPGDVPLVRVGGESHPQVTPERLRSLLRRWSAR